MENQIINAIEGENLSVSGILFAESEREEDEEAYEQQGEEELTEEFGDSEE